MFGSRLSSPLPPPRPPRKQLQELSGQHQQELSAQLAQFKVETAEREERQQQVVQDYELRYCRWRVPAARASLPAWSRCRGRPAATPCAPMPPQLLPRSPAAPLLRGRGPLSRLFSRLAREQARVRELQSGRQRLEEQRTELVERLQAMLQAHWEEASQLLGAPALPPDPPVRIALFSVQTDRA